MASAGASHGPGALAGALLAGRRGRRWMGLSSQGEHRLARAENGMTSGKHLRGWALGSSYDRENASHQVAVRIGWEALECPARCCRVVVGVHSDKPCTPPRGGWRPRRGLISQEREGRARAERAALCVGFLRAGAVPLSCLSTCHLVTCQVGAWPLFL